MNANARSSLPASVSVRSQGFALTDALREFALHRAKAALQIAEHALRAVDVQLCDTNGPRGGIDKRCALHIQLGQGPVLRVVDVQSDMYTAIECAFHRCKQTLRRRIDRTRKKSAQQAPWMPESLARIPTQRN
jgi:putative sigma-54 modulation protein